MSFRGWLEEKMDVFLAPSACLVVEFVFKIIPGQASILQRSMAVRNPKNPDKRVYLNAGERFELLGFAGERGKDRRIIAMTSKGILSFPILSSGREDGII